MSLTSVPVANQLTDPSLAHEISPMIPAILDMSIIGDWSVSITKVDDEDRIEHAGRAEVAIFAKISPVPGTVLKLLHLNEKIYLKHKDYRVIPLLPDGSSPRIAPGPQALGIPVVAGRRRTSDGKVSQWLPTITKDVLDGSYDSDDDEATESTAETLCFPAASLTDGAYYPSQSELDIAPNDTDNAGTSDVSKKWAEVSYNGGTRLVDREGFLYIEFGEKICLDPFVVEIYLDIEPIKLDKEDRYCFILGALPYCANGINILFEAEIESTRNEWIFKTEPSLQNTVSARRNLLSGSYFSSAAESDALIIRARFVPYRYDAEIRTKVRVIPHPDASLLTFHYKVKVIFNEQASETQKTGELRFKVLDVLPDDAFIIEENFGEIRKEQDFSYFKINGVLLYIYRKPKDCFANLKFEIVATRILDLVKNVAIPRILPLDGYLVEHTVLLERLGDQPLKWTTVNMPGKWEIISEERRLCYDQAFRTMFDAQTLYQPLRVTVEEALKCPNLPEQLLADAVVNNVLYTLWMEPGPDPLHLQFSGSVSVEISYQVSNLLHNERVFTLDSGDCHLNRSTVFFNDSSFTEHRLHEIHDQNWVGKWIVKHNQLDVNSGNRKSTVTMVSVWDVQGVVGSSNLDVNGEALGSQATSDKDDCFTLPSLIDRYCDYENFQFCVKVTQESTTNGLSTVASPAVTILNRSTLDHNCNGPEHLYRDTLIGEIYSDRNIFITRRGGELKAHILYPVVLDTNYRKHSTSKNEGTDTMAESSSVCNNSANEALYVPELNVNRTSALSCNSPRSSNSHEGEWNERHENLHSIDELQGSSEEFETSRLPDISLAATIPFAEEVAEALKPKRTTANAASMTEPRKPKVRYRHRLVGTDYGLEVNPDQYPWIVSSFKDVGAEAMAKRSRKADFCSNFIGPWFRFALLFFLMIFLYLAYLNLMYSQERLMDEIVSLRYEVAVLTHNLKSREALPKDFVYRINDQEVKNTTMAIVEPSGEHQEPSLDFNKQDIGEEEGHAEPQPGSLDSNEIISLSSTPQRLLGNMELADSYTSTKEVKGEEEIPRSNFVHDHDDPQVTPAMFKSLQTYRRELGSIQTGIFDGFKRFIAEVWESFHGNQRPQLEGQIDREEKTGKGGGWLFRFLLSGAGGVRLFI